MTYCEDYPCCGHTNEDPCERQPYDEPGYYDTSIRGNEHALCDHENGECDVDYDDYDEADDEDVAEFIRLDNEARLDQMYYELGVEPSGWEDSY
jgi:hypothetical protein